MKQGIHYTIAFLLHTMKAVFVVVFMWFAVPVFLLTSYLILWARQREIRHREEENQQSKELESKL
jgi:predicted membrane protein